MDAGERLHPGQVDHLAGHRCSATQDELPTSVALGVADLDQEPDQGRAHESDATRVYVDCAGIAVDELSGRETERAAVPQIDLPMDPDPVGGTVRRSRDGQPPLARGSASTPRLSKARERRRPGQRRMADMRT